VEDKVTRPTTPFLGMCAPAVRTVIVFGHNENHFPSGVRSFDVETRAVVAIVAMRDPFNIDGEDVDFDVVFAWGGLTSAESEQKRTREDDPGKFFDYEVVCCPWRPEEDDAMLARSRERVSLSLRQRMGLPLSPEPEPCRST
jgi:hypothetical protein